MNDNPRTLSPSESRIVLGLQERGERRLTRRQIIDQLQTSPNAADQIIRSLRQKGWIEKAGWGRYLLVPAEYGPDRIGETSILALASHIVDPYWFAWSTAAQIHGLTTQYRWQIWVATTRQARRRELHDHRIDIVKVVEQRAFGIETVEKDGVALQVSDRERTLLDCVEKPKRAGGLGEVAMMISFARKDIDWQRLVAHARRFGNVAAVQRLGWLADRIGIPFPADARARLKALIRPGHRAPLDPSAAAGKSRYDPQWQVWVNVPDEQLASETPLRSPA